MSSVDVGGEKRNVLRLWYEPVRDVDESRPWQLVRAALPRTESEACSYFELWMRVQVPPHVLDAGLDALREQPDGTVHQSAGRYWYRWCRRAADAGRRKDDHR